MTQLINLQRRIKAVGATKKVTRAMRLIAVAAYGKIKNRHEASAGYRSIAEGILARLLKVATNLCLPVFQPTDTTNINPLFIIISSTRGLCGPFNTNLTQYAAENLKFRRHQHPTFITIGKRAQQLVMNSVLYRAKETYTIATHFETFNQDTVDSIARIISTTILNKKKPFSQVCVLYNSFRNLFIQNPTLRTVIPLTSQTNATFDDDCYFLWEQKESIIINELANIYLYSTIRQSLLESLLAENAARSVAMDKATSGAEKHMDTLVSQHNRIRQSLITREVTELSSTL